MEQIKAMRRTRRNAEVEALRVGRKVRPTIIPNKKKKSDREACRKGNW